MTSTTSSSSLSPIKKLTSTTNTTHKNNFSANKSPSPSRASPVRASPARASPARASPGRAISPKRDTASPKRDQSSPFRSKLPRRTPDKTTSPVVAKKMSADGGKGQNYSSSSTYNSKHTSPSGDQTTTTSSTTTTKRYSSYSGPAAGSPSAVKKPLDAVKKSSLPRRSPEVAKRNSKLLDEPAAGSTSPKLSSYRGTAEKCKFEGDTMRHFNAGKLATFELKAPGHPAKDVQVNIISK
jgi:hypothetical protein